MRNTELKKWLKTGLVGYLAFLYASFAYVNIAFAGEASLPSLKQKVKQQESLQLKTLLACLHDFAVGVQAASKDSDSKLTSCQGVFTKISDKLLPDQSKLIDEHFLRLQTAVSAKKSVAKAALLSSLDSLVQALIDAYQIKTSPALNPDRELSQKLYKNFCESCHGVDGRGDGILAAKLPTKPSDFTSESFAATSSPLMALNTLLLGKSKSAMPAFSDLLTVEELWGLSFLVQGFYWRANLEAGKDGKEGLGLLLKNKLKTQITYGLLARRRDAELVPLIKDQTVDQGLFLYWARVEAPYGMALSRLQGKTP